MKTQERMINTMLGLVNSRKVYLTCAGILTCSDKKVYGVYEVY